MSSFNVGWLNATVTPPTNYTERTALTPPDYMSEISLAFYRQRQFVDRSKLVNAGGTGQVRVPIMGKTVAPVYHTQGARLLGQTQLPKNYRSVQFDDRLVSHQFLDENDKAMQVVNWDADIGAQLGNSLANAEDTNAAIALLLSARNSSNVTGISGGSTLALADANVNADALEALLWAAKETLDSKDVPASDRFFALRSQQYNMLALRLGSRYFDRQLGQTSGSYSMPELPMIAGMEPLWSNNIPSTNIASTPTGANNTYAGDFTKTLGSVWRRDAFMTAYLNPVSQKPSNPATTEQAKSSPLSVLMKYIDEACGYLYAAKLTVGIAPFRQDQAIELALP